MIMIMIMIIIMFLSSSLGIRGGLEHELAFGNPMGCNISSSLGFLGILGFLQMS